LTAAAPALAGCCCAGTQGSRRKHSRLGANHGLLLGFCRRPTRRPPGWMWFGHDKLADKRKTAKRLALSLQMLPRPGSFLLRPHCRACERIVTSDRSLRCVMARRQFFSSEEMPPGAAVTTQIRGGRPSRGRSPSAGLLSALLRATSSPTPQACGFPVQREPRANSASTSRSTSKAPALSSGSLPLPHLGDCTHDGHPLGHSHASMAAAVAPNHVLA
jgi:hypothetical protein